MEEEQEYDQGQGKRLSDLQLGYMRGLYDSGVKPCDISSQMNVALSTVSRSILDEEEKQLIISAVEKDRNLTAADIVKDAVLNQKGVSASTIERLLNEVGLKCRRKRPMQNFSENNKVERYRISKIFCSMSQNELDKIFYTDECNVCVKQNGLQFVRKYDDESWGDSRFRKPQEARPLSIQIWMIIGKNGVEHLHWMNDITYINGDYYRNQILKKYILSDSRFKIGSEEGFIFQHDQASSHSAKQTEDLLEEHQVNKIEWPPKGADLSPIENCFSEIQRLSKFNQPQIRTQEELWQFISDLVFKQDFDTFILKCYQGIKQRWKQVKKNRGDVIEK